MHLQSNYSLSYWEQDIFFRDLDAVVIGSGIVGLSAALRLRELQPGRRIAVFERGPLPIGASTRNAGFACFGSMTELIDDLRHMEEGAVWRLVEKRRQGLQRLRRRLGDERLDFHGHGGYELFRSEDEEVFEACTARMEQFNRILKDITGQSQVFTVADAKLPEFGFRGVQHLILNKAEGQLHPGRMVEGLLQMVREAGIRVFTGLPVHALEDDGVRVQLQAGPGWTVSAGHVLVATNGFARQLLPELPLRPARNQVLVTEPLKDLRIKGTFHYDRGYYYFRNTNGRVLLGGGRHLAVEEETTTTLGTSKLIRNALLKLLREVILPGRQVKVEHWWSGVLGVGEEKSPVIRKVSPRITVALRLGGMGVAIGSLVGEEGAELVERGEKEKGDGGERETGR